MPKIEMLAPDQVEEHWEQLGPIMESGCQANEVAVLEINSKDILELAKTGMCAVFVMWEGDTIECAVALQFGYVMDHKYAEVVSFGGLALYSPISGGALITKVLEDWDTWTLSLDPSTLDAEFFDDKYLGVHSEGMIIFERDDKVGGLLVTSTYTPTALHYDAPSGRLFYADDTAGDIYKWNNITQPNAVMEWKSKVLETNNFINLGAARVVADYINVSTVWDLTNSN